MKKSSATSGKSGHWQTVLSKRVLCLYAFLMVLAAISTPRMVSQEVHSSKLNKTFVHGVVFDAGGTPVIGAIVHLQREDTQKLDDQLTSETGEFTFPISGGTSYSLTAEKSGKHSTPFKIFQGSSQTETKVELVLNQDGPSDKPPIAAMQFADQPNFTVAGVTDFTAAGGHGSDSSLRTSEALARETSTLKSANSVADSQAGKDSEDRLKAALAAAPQSFKSNHLLGDFYLHEGRYSDALPLLQTAYQIEKTDNSNEYDLALACKGIGDPAHSRKYVQELLTRQESADYYRLAADLDESLGDSLAAVREYQKAVALQPSEPNFFSWGSELLLHRAIWQAQQVFEQGVQQYPTSSRMLTGLGTALFAGAAYNEAATKLCQASDLNPLDEQPYIFLGKVQMAAPDRLACIEQKLQRFVQQKPDSPVANYLYAMALQKSHETAPGADALPQPESLLKKAISIDPTYADAYFQLGILYASRRDFDLAIDSYTKAIAANPQLSDAYYRLAVAYDRTGQPAKAKEEFKLHDKVAKEQAAEIERQRQEVKQFLVVLSPDAAHTSAQ